VVVVAAVLVVGDDEQRSRPTRPVAHRLDHLGEHRLAHDDVLGVLLGLGVEVLVEEGGTG
jgi:hypothetical protein